MPPPSPALLPLLLPLLLLLLLQAAADTVPFSSLLSPLSSGYPLGFSQLLLADTAEGHPPDPGTWRSRVSQVQASGEHLLALIDDVLELSSLESGELPLSLQPVALVH